MKKNWVIDDGSTHLTLWIDDHGIVRKTSRKDIKAIFYYDENRKLHRADGPATECFDVKKWFYHGECIECNSQEELERILKLKAFW